MRLLRNHIGYQMARLVLHKPYLMFSAHSPSHTMFHHFDRLLCPNHFYVESIFQLMENNILFRRFLGFCHTRLRFYDFLPHADLLKLSKKKTINDTRPNPNSYSPLMFYDTTSLTHNISIHRQCIKLVLVFRTYYL